MSDEFQVEKILSKALTLEKAFGKTRGAFVLIFALWTLRGRDPFVRFLILSASLLMAVWFKLGIVSATDQFY